MFQHVLYYVRTCRTYHKTTRAEENEEEGLGKINKDALMTMLDKRGMPECHRDDHSPVGCCLYVQIVRYMCTYVLGAACLPGKPTQAAWKMMMITLKKHARPVVLWFYSMYMYSYVYSNPTAWLTPLERIWPLFRGCWLLWLDPFSFLSYSCTLIIIATESTPTNSCLYVCTRTFMVLCWRRKSMKVPGRKQWSKSFCSFPACLLCLLLLVEWALGLVGTSVVLCASGTYSSHSAAAAS